MIGRERGAGTVLIMAVMLIAAMTAFISACLLAWVGCAHKARSVADLAALAASQAYANGQDACPVAKLTASSNGATMTACAVESNGVNFVVTVTVMVQASPQLGVGPDHFTQTSAAGNL